MRVLLRALVAFLAVSTAAAQPPQLDPSFPRRPVSEALKESVEKKRILVIFINTGTSAHKLVEQNTLPNRTLEAWMLWHGVGVNLAKDEDPRGYQLVTKALRSGDLRVPFETFPTFVMFMDGKFVRSYPDETFHRFLWENPLGFADGPPSPEMFYPKVTQVLYNLDFLMDKLASTEPVWTEFHNLRNPMPEAPPPPPPLFATDDGLALTVDDPLAILQQARDAIAAGGHALGIGYYTLLYERGQAIDPAIRPALLSFIAEETAALVRTEPQARKRLETLRQRLGDRFLFWQYPDFVEWMALTEIVNAEGENLTLLASALIDEQEATMLPRAELAALNTMQGLERFTRPRDVSKSDLEFFRKLLQQSQSPRPGSAPADEWAEAITFRKQVVTEYGSRLYAALLLQRREQEAADVARDTIARGHDPQLARISLIVTALAAQIPPREQFRNWLKESEAASVARPWLAKRLAPAAP